MQKKLYLVSLGCNKNLVDSEIMLARLKDYTLMNNPNEADVLIVNTCGFIGPAKEESLQTIFSLNESRKKDSLLVVAGCLSERYKEDLQKELPEVDLFTGVGDYDAIDEIISKRQNRFTPRTYLLDEENRIITGSSHHAYIKLSEGCNQQCSFCAIPTFKGKLLSRTLTSIKKELERLVDQGFYDFSFISQDSSSYLRDLGNKEGLIDLIEMVEQIKGVKSARILYLYPSTTSNALIQKIIDSKVFHNYFDMPIQHINDSMLKIMKRGANKARIMEQLTMMRQAPDSFVRTGLIIGHPGEKKDYFDELCDFIKDFHFDRVSLFAYSDEEDTSAFDMQEKIDDTIIQDRLEYIDTLVKTSTQYSLEKELEQKITLIPLGQSEEHEYFISARKLLWAPNIDGEILINDSQIDGQILFGKPYEALVSEKAGDTLVATVTKAL